MQGQGCQQVHPGKRPLAAASSHVQHHYRSTAYDTTAGDESSRLILQSTETPSHDPAYSSTASRLNQDRAEPAEADLQHMIRRQMEQNNMINAQSAAAKEGLLAKNAPFTPSSVVSSGEN